MVSRPYKATLFALYQLSLLVGIAVLPVAVVASRAGVELPIHRIITRLGEAYERTNTETA